MEQTIVEGMTVECEVTGTGEPVILILGRRSPKHVTSNQRPASPSDRVTDLTRAGRFYV
jgi:hypothetical protein